jgi:SAM-dependent methyltransferase
MWTAGKLPRPKQLRCWQEEMDTMAKHIKKMALCRGALNILEAGCGISWALDLDGVEYALTGVDLDKNALDIRKDRERDLDIAILGDLRNVCLQQSKFDVIYNSYVLEHIDGAEDVLENFIRWLNPGGILILRIPNRDSARGFLTRITPFWFHILYVKYIQGDETAGRPGHAPFPTFFDKIVSRNGIHEFCKNKNLVIEEEYGGGIGRKNSLFPLIERIVCWVLHMGSLKRLSFNYPVLIYVIKKL